MNTARTLGRRLLRCSPLSVRTICTTRTSVIRNGLLEKKTLGVFAKRLPITRSMGSTTKFEVINIQDEKDFNKRVIENSVPVVVDFHATWCGPCKILGPRLESLLGKEEGKVLMAKVDIDENPDLAMEYGVRSVPTVVGMKNGKVQNQFIGVIDDDQINTFVDKLIIS